MDDSIKQNIVNYYQSSQWIYKNFCYNSQSLGMHFGFWNNNTKNLQEALINENDEVIKTAQIKKNMKVLDAGCGVGGTAIRIAEKTGAKIWGITITPEQVKLANKYAQQRGAKNFVDFSVQDYTKTTFPLNFFDVVIGVESICHASPKTGFLKEAYRVLKPGGKLVIADAYLAREPKNDEERKIVNRFKWGFALHEFITEKHMGRQLKKAGFVQLQRKNMTKAIEPSVAYFANFGGKTKLICIAAKYIPISYSQAIYKNYLSTKMSAEGYKKGLAAYYIHTGEKPI